MPQIPYTAADQLDSSDLISFLKAIPDGLFRRGVRYSQWFLLLVALFGNISGSRSYRDLEAFANGICRRSTRRWAWISSVGRRTPPSYTSTAPRKPDGYNRLIC